MRLSALPHTELVAGSCGSFCSSPASAGQGLIPQIAPCIDDNDVVTKFVLPVSASGFSKPYSHVNGSTDLNTSFHSVVRALVTTGHLPAFTKPFDDYRSASIRMRVALGQAHLAVRNNRTRSQLVPSPEWARLDPSEKAFASFLLGSAMASSRATVSRLP